MKTKLCIIMIFAAITSINAQMIRGKIVDSNHEPIETAVIVLQTLDSVFINSTYTDTTGSFTFKSELANFRLVIQHLNFNTLEQSFSTEQVGTLQLTEKENSLKEIVIKGEHPLVRVVDGRMTYDMPRLLEGKVISNAYESLLQLPGIREQEGNLVLAGSSSLTVILNGKPTTMTNEQLMEVLKNTPKERIEKVEVMYSAPPQYHIRGGAVNLVLKKNYADKSQWQGQVNTEYTQKHLAGYSTGMTLLFTSSKFSADFLYSLNQSHNRQDFNLYSYHFFNSQIHTIEQYNMGDKKRLNHMMRFGTDYLMDDKNKISFSYTSQLTPVSKEKEFSEGSFSNSINKKENEKPIRMHNGTLNYNSGFGMDAGIDYTFYQSQTIQDFEEMQAGKENVFQTFSKQNINRFSAYFNQKHELQTDWTLSYGSKYIVATDKSSQIYYSMSEQDLSNSNTSNKLKEYTFNLYAGFEKSFNEKLSVSASLTGEYYKHDNFNEWSLFPQLEATYINSPTSIWQLSMSSNKEYPEYWEMQGYIGYLNGYMEGHGNPNLKPCKDYSSQLTYVLKNKYAFTAYWQYSDNYFAQLPYQSPNKLALIYKTTNFDYKQQFGISASIPFKTGSILDSRLTINGYYDKVKSSHFHDLSFNNDNWALYSQLNNTLTLSSKPNIRLEINGRYTTKNIQGPMTIDNLWAVDVGLKWSFAKENAELRLKGTDIFNSWSPRLAENFSTQNLAMNMIPDLRAVILSFSYKFGGYKNKERKEVDSSRFGSK